MTYTPIEVHVGRADIPAHIAAGRRLRQQVDDANEAWAAEPSEENRRTLTFVMSELENLIGLYGDVQ